MAEQQDTPELETRMLFDMVDGLQDLDDTLTDSGNSAAEMSSIRRDIELRQIFGGGGLNICCRHLVERNGSRQWHSWVSFARLHLEAT